MADLIYTRKPDASELSLDEIRERAPAVFTSHKAPDRSSRYGFVSTLSMLDQMRDIGYVPVQAAQTKSRTWKGESYGQHFVSFARADDLEVRNREERPEALLYNSHDGLSRVKLYLGCLRFACSNGIVVGADSEIAVKHMTIHTEGFASAATQAVESLSEVQRRIADLKTRFMSYDASRELARRAAAMRWSDYNEAVTIEAETGQYPRGSYYTDRTLANLGRVTRTADRGNNAWMIFNRIQESIIRGGAEIMSITDRSPRGMYRRSRGIGSVAENLRINRALWDSAVELAAA